MPNTGTLCLLAVLTLLAGCTQWRYHLGDPLDYAQQPPLEKGITLQQALDVLGPPLRLSASDGGYVMAWEHWHISENTIGVSLGALGADFLSVDWGAMHAQGEFLLLTFDLDRTLTSVSHSTWDSKRGGGQAVQPFVGVVSVVEAGDLLEELPQHRWGFMQLQRMPTALNQGSSPDSGDAGLEQRGTPPSMGQRSLEMP